MKLKWNGANPIIGPGGTIQPGEEIEIADEDLASEVMRDTKGWEKAGASTKPKKSADKPAEPEE